MEGEERETTSMDRDLVKIVETMPLTQLLGLGPKAAVKKVCATCDHRDSGMCEGLPFCNGEFWRAEHDEAEEAYWTKVMLEE